VLVAFGDDGQPVLGTTGSDEELDQLLPFVSRKKDERK
jgi:hypothetical protein